MPDSRDCALSTPRLNHPGMSYITYTFPYIREGNTSGLKNWARVSERSTNKQETVKSLNKDLGHQLFQLIRTWKQELLRIIQSKWLYTCTLFFAKKLLQVQLKFWNWTISTSYEILYISIKCTREIIIWQKHEVSLHLCLLFFVKLKLSLHSSFTYKC